ncbi:MAG: M20/M25/M40 family metallo-hydrolase [Oscillospiraceae bacterium]|jgi:hypothetical protein|nr:M20/M25/M40 family metallo-hydrolase [Oscillospiraceae bacterium]
MKSSLTKARRARVLAMVIVAALLTLSACALADAPVTPIDAQSTVLSAFADKIDVEYAKSALENIRAFGNNPDLGFRNAGSAAELETGDYIAAEMERFGFTVTKEPVELDTWTFKEGSVIFTDTEGGEYTALLAAEQIDFHVKDQAYEIIYANSGTDADYEGLDVAGKFVLVDINQVEDWWINWPAYQAVAKGAAGVIAVSSGGYATYTEDTLGVQDYCGPADVPALNISITDGNALKAAIEKNGGSVTAILTVDSTVTYSGEAYSIVCELPGTDGALQSVSLIGHYDGYFHAFDDNASGSAALLGIAKAMSDSGYKPRRSIRIVFNPAEEWGFADSRYDWAAGCWVSTRNHPEWADDTFLTINIDGGVVHGSADSYRMRVPYEFADFILSYGKSVDGNPLDGFDVSSPMWTWTEGWPYSISGIPVIDSGMIEDDGVGESAYHSSSDNEESSGYDPETFAYSIKLYGSLAIMFDQTDVRPTDYASFFRAFASQINTDGDENASALAAAAAAAEEASVALAERLLSVPTEDADAVNRQLNALYKDIQQKLYTIDWNESVQFVYKYKQTNVAALRDAIEAVKVGDAITALDEYLWQIDLNWYAYSFDEATVEYFINQVLRPDAKNAWGTGYIDSAANLHGVIRSLMEKNDSGSADFADEIAILERELSLQEEDLNAVIVEAIADIESITEVIGTIAK